MDSTIPCVRMNDTEETLTESITSSTVSRNSTQTKGADPSAIRSMLGVKPGNRSGLSSPGELRRMYTVTKQSSMLMGVLKGAGEGISAASSTYNTPNGSDSSVATDSNVQDIGLPLRNECLTGSIPILYTASNDSSGQGTPLNAKSRKRESSMASSLSGLNTSPSGKFTPTQIGRHKPSNSNSITQSASQPTLVLSNPELNMDIFDSKYLAETQKLIPEMDILGQSKIRDTWSAIKQKRMEMLETVLAKISHPVLGIQQKKKMLSISKYTMSFAGSDIFDWLVANCRFLVKEEALKFAQELMDCGYLISTEHVEKFDAYASQYVIQHPAFWPTRGGLPNDYDYTVNLLKRGLRNNIRDILKFYEEERLDILRKSYHTVWYEMEGKALFELKHEKGMKAGDRRMFRVQEAAFWRLHRSATPGVPKMFSDESKDAEHKTDRYTETEYCDSLTEKEQLKFLERKLEQLQVSVTQNRLKISETCKSIVHRCNIFKAVDAMLSACSNPWIQDDPLLWDVVRTTPRRCDVVLWCYSLENLLNDPLGLKYFNDFLAKEFSQENLHFYLKCRGMGEAASNKEFSDRAILTYLQFIKVGSPNELNINSNTRLAISAIFEPKDSPPPTKIPFDCFDDACEHVFALMAKDSYSRFCNSDTIQALLENSPVI